MKVSVKDLSVTMEIKNKGIELDVYDSTGAHRGDLVINKAKVTWCPGKTLPQNGHSLTWESFITIMEKQKK
jgi:hypothetical protein